MPTTTDALVIAVLFLLPGVLFETGIERSSGYWHTRFGERSVRYFRSSCAFLPFTILLLWTVERLRPELIAWGVAALNGTAGLASGTAATREALDSLVQLGLPFAAFLVLPYATGYVMGLRRRRKPWKAPRAWDYLFLTEGLTGIVRVRLRTGKWVAGLYVKGEGTGADSGYASSYPDPPCLYLPVQVGVDAQTGELMVDGDGRPLLRQWGLLLDGPEIELLEVQPFEGSVT